MSSLNDTRRIPLYGKGREITAHALVDATDFDWLSQYRWGDHDSGYARRSTSRAGGQKMTVVYMHRQILGLEKGDQRQADHINQDKHDNRRENLRVVTSAENKQNVGSRKGAQSRYRGVTRTGKTWTAQYGDIHLGCFMSEMEAATAAAQYRHEHVAIAEEDPEMVNRPKPKRLVPYRNRKRVTK